MTRAGVWNLPSPPGLLTEQPWRADAACRGVDPELFFPERGDNHGVTAAKAVCVGCPVRTECLEANIMEKVGVWGGLSERERRKLRRARGRVQRPVASCGTNAAYRRHLVHREEPCGPCKAAHAAYKRSHSAISPADSAAVDCLAIDTVVERGRARLERFVAEHLAAQETAA